MPFLVVGSVTVPVPPGGVRKRPIAIGEQDRAMDGTPLSDVTGHRDEWTVRTLDMTRANANALEAVLRGAMPVTCSGDLLGGTISCDVVVGETSDAEVGRFVVEFTLRGGA